MEEINPWLDPDSGKHKNKKSTKPKVEEKEEVVVKEVKKKEEVKKLNSDFLKNLVEDSLQPTFPKKVNKWVLENLDEKWLEEFLFHVNKTKENILSSDHSPTTTEIILLKYIFLLQQNY